MRTTVRLTLGDWSNDGHGRTETIIAEVVGDDCHFDLNEGYKAALAAGIVDLEEDVCRDYEDSKISKDDLSAILAITGTSLDDLNKLIDTVGDYSEPLDFDSEENDESGIYLTSDSFAALWVTIVNFGLKQLKKDAVVVFPPKIDKPKEYRLGGYGMFYG